MEFTTATAWAFLPAQTQSGRWQDQASCSSAAEDGKLRRPCTSSLRRAPHFPTEHSMGANEQEYIDTSEEEAVPASCGFAVGARKFLTWIKVLFRKPTLLGLAEGWQC